MPIATTTRLIALLASLAPAAIAGGQPQGEVACVERTVEAVQGHYESLRDLRARFAQTSTSVAFGSASAGAAQRSSGVVVFAKPGKMRWSYEAPEPSLVVSDGQTLWIFDPARAEVQRLPVSGGYLSGAAIQFLLGQGDIQAEFEVAARSCGDAAVELELLPRAPATYEKLRITADPATGRLLATSITDLLGNVTEIAFRDIEENRDPPEAVFQFEAPEGVRIIDLQPVGGERR